MVNYFTRGISFEKVNSLDFGAIVDGSQSYVGPERDYTVVEIPGRNGDLTVDNGRYKNVEVKYKLFFPDSAMMEAFRVRIQSLTGYHRLEDDYRPDEYRFARLSGGFEPAMSGALNRSGEVELVFDCQPQRFLKRGEYWIYLTRSGTIVNPSLYPSKPILRVYGSGDVTIDAETITVDAHSYEYVDIDCELGDCTSGSINMNGFVKLSGRDFPVLGPGSIKISLSAGVTKLKILPRWWTL